jgi:hypothetical protein
MALVDALRVVRLLILPSVATRHCSWPFRTTFPITLVALFFFSVIAVRFDSLLPVATCYPYPVNVVRWTTLCKFWNFRRGFAGGRSEVHLVPTQVHQFGCSQAVPVGRKDHRGVAVAMAVAFGRLHEPPGPPGGNCSFYGGWRDQLEVRLNHAFGPPNLTDCSYNGRSRNSKSDLAACAGSHTWLLLLC